MATNASVAETLAGIVTGALGRELPVRLRALGRQRDRTGRHARAWCSARDGRSATSCGVPGELGLARAYVAGDLDVEGDVEEGFHLMWAVARERGAPVKFGAAGGCSTRSFTAIRLGAIGLRPSAPGSRSAARSDGSTAAAGIGRRSPITTTCRTTSTR